MHLTSTSSIAERDAAYRAIAAGLPDMLVVVFDADLRIRMLEGGGLAQALLPGSAYEGRDVAILVAPDAREETIIRHKAALAGHRSTFPCTTVSGGRQYHVTVGPLDGGSASDPLGIAVWHDVTDRNEVHARLQHLADHDPLTGLVNRRRFEQDIDHHLSLCRRYGPRGAVLLIDVDHFKYVNDTLGHAAGDELIAQVAEALQTRLRESDVLARLGGDEFAVLLPQVDLAGAEAVAESLVADLRGHARGKEDDRPRPVTASIGVAVVGPSEFSANELLTQADLAMYDAKEAGRDQYAVYRDEAAEMEAGTGAEIAGIRTRVRWLDRVQVALEQDRFVLHGQPIVELATGATVGHELLLRMLGEGDALIPPVAFLPVAERFGLIPAVDRWVIAKAIGLAAAHGSRFSINLSARSLAQTDLVDFIADRIAGEKVDPSQLTFEITETAAVTNIASAQTFAEGLHDLGCRLSLDDFGAGFGTFSYLKHLPFDEVKIDGEFVSGCTRSGFDQMVIDAVVRMASTLGKTTVAEFTGDRETTDLLRDAGVTYAQGFHLGRPGPLVLDRGPAR
ncbi:EAL domain-containing protein [Paraconexibacter antarcticus]|uniref:EAL domain-containing protein n=1 Tax=Paraconexibacter antarcticus TaxID=2949664 RepID=A0ABY5DUR6_9ACTN|nr:EAL domain-containing protein [Paraconexibacter antarcticus]UTI64664.1 EAL domain-containing protein [Paraconexibacter antarcticus]